MILQIKYFCNISHLLANRRRASWVRMFSDSIFRHAERALAERKLWDGNGGRVILNKYNMPTTETGKKSLQNCQYCF